MGWTKKVLCAFEHSLQDRTATCRFYLIDGATNSFIAENEHNLITDAVALSFPLFFNIFSEILMESIINNGNCLPDELGLLKNNLDE